MIFPPSLMKILILLNEKHLILLSLLREEEEIQLATLLFLDMNHVWKIAWKGSGQGGAENVKRCWFANKYNAIGILSIVGNLFQIGFLVSTIGWHVIYLLLCAVFYFFIWEFLTFITFLASPNWNAPWTPKGELPFQRSCWSVESP